MLCIRGSAVCPMYVARGSGRVVQYSALQSTVRGSGTVAVHNHNQSYNTVPVISLGFWVNAKKACYILLLVSGDLPSPPHVPYVRVQQAKRDRPESKLKQKSVCRNRWASK